MGADPGSAAGAGRACGRDRQGQPAVCRGRALPLSDWHSLARSARAPWRDLPERFGCGVKIQTRFSRWAKTGVWERVFRPLAADADNEYAMIDSTIVRAHQHAASAPKKLDQTRRSGAARAG